MIIIHLRSGESGAACADASARGGGRRKSTPVTRTWLSGQPGVTPMVPGQPGGFSLMVSLEDLVSFTRPANGLRCGFGILWDPWDSLGYSVV